MSELETTADGGEASTHPAQREPFAQRPVVGQRLAHYDLVGWLGAGGMGEVFRARDTALGRDAALKLIPRRFTTAMKQGLLREAEASAKLQHPAIATFYEAGEHAGEAFIAMEFVEGVTLRRRLAEGPITLAQALSITRCLLEALQHAHNAGILHRDIKPENIVVTGPDAAKVLDFGLALHLLVPDGQSPGSQLGGVANVTSAGVAGTVGYMAPEQLRCEALDSRTDVFQVGAVLYEMVTGSPAFPGLTPAERIEAVMLRDPDFSAPALTALPVGVRRMLGRALMREPAGRYPSAAAFLTDLEDLGGFARGRPLTLAVLDLEDLTVDDDTAWVGTAVADTLRTSLSGAETLNVLPRERVLAAVKAVALSDRDTGAVAVGLRLGCDRVVSGSYRATATGVTITLNLHDVSTGRLASSRVVEGPTAAVLDLESQLRDGLFESLNVASSASPRGPVSVEAHQSFARARRLLDGLNKGAVDQARGLLDRAVDLEPGYTAALAALANAYAFRSIATTDPTDLSRAIAFADRAIAGDPGNSEAYTWKGYALMRQSRFEEAAEAYSCASKIDPTHAPAQYFAGSGLLFVGRIADALPLLQRAVDLDPRLGMPWLGLGAAHLSLGHLPEARYSFERARALEGETIRFEIAGSDAYVADVLRAQGHCDEARARVLVGLESVERSDHAYRDTFRAYALVVLGRTALDQGDLDAARAAFGQVLAQAQGRPRTRSCGQLVVRATVGLAAAGRSVELYKEAAHLYQQRTTYNFEPFFGALEHQALFEIARVAQFLGLAAEADAFLERSRQAGETRVLPG